jgi:hypothetical protein
MIWEMVGLALLEQVSLVQQLVLHRFRIFGASQR